MNNQVIIDDAQPLTKEFTFAVRTELTGTKIGPLILEAQAWPVYIAHVIEARIYSSQALGSARWLVYILVYIAQMNQDYMLPLRSIYVYSYAYTLSHPKHT